jgi:hypothetical protein
VADHIVPGMGFEALLRMVVAAGLVPESQGDEDAWIRQRLDEHRNRRGGRFLRQMANGRWRRIIVSRLLLDEQTTFQFTPPQNSMLLLLH